MPWGLYVSLDAVTQSQMEIDQNELPKLSQGVPEEVATDLNLEGKM